MASIIPISKTNIVCLMDREAAWGILNGTPAAKKLAYNANGLARQQALEANVELRGTRKPGALVPGQKNPSGPVNGHQTDLTSVMFYEATLGHRVSTELACIGLTASASLVSGAGLVTTGSHSYKIVVTKGALGYTLPSAKSNVVSTDTGSNGQVDVSRTGGALPSGWAWNIYRTVTGDTGTWKLVNPTPLGAAVTTYRDNIADGSLGADAPSASTCGDYSHVMTVAETLPSYSFERQHAYIDGTYDYPLALGCSVDTARFAMKATGFDDFDGTMIARSVTTGAASSLGTPTPTDWRFGEKIHHAMIGAGMVTMDGPNFVGYLQDLTYTHNNNIDKSDYPMGYQGDRGSAVALQSVGAIAGNMKVSDKSILPLLQDYSVKHAVTVKHQFATFGHYKLHEFLAVQFDPADAPVSGQGILLVPYNGHVVTDDTTGEQTRVTVVNSVPGTAYDAPA